METVDPDGVKLQRYRISKENLGGEGVKLGAAYRLAGAVPAGPAGLAATAAG